MSRRPARGPSQRQLRVAEELRHALATVVQRGEVRDPAVAEASITVTEVRVSPDMRHATVFIAPLGGGEAHDSVQALTRARPFLRHRIAELVRLKYVPDLTIRADEAFDEAERIERLLRTPDVAKDLAPGAPSNDGDDRGGT